MTRRSALTTLLLVVAGLSASCAGRDPGSPAGDCAYVVRRAGHDYADAGFVEQDFRRLGIAEVAACRDRGPETLGPYFTDHPEVTAVSSVGDLDPGLVVAVRDGAHDAPLRVLVRLDAAPGEVDAVMVQLSR